MSPSRSLVVTGKNGGRMNSPNAVAEAAGVVLGRAVDVEPGARLEHGREERQALHVVPVDVGDERRARRRARCGSSVSPQKRSPVPRSRTIGSWPGRLERDARGVAAVAAVGVARARGRTPDAEEADVEQRIPPCLKCPVRYRRLVPRCWSCDGGLTRPCLPPKVVSSPTTSSSRTSRRERVRWRSASTASPTPRGPTVTCSRRWPTPASARWRRGCAATRPPRCPPTGATRPPRSASTPARCTRRSAATATR